MKITKLNSSWPVGQLMCSAVLLVGLSGCNGPANEPVEPITKPKAKVVHFDQGWTQDDAVVFYNRTQGSHLLPYDWFLALEQHDNGQLFRDDKNIRKFGYIPQPKIAGDSPDGLPIGFVKDDRADEFLTNELTRDRLSSGSTNKWLGLTCAACHTSEMTYNGQRLRINGGPPLSDMQSLLQEMSRALLKTTEDDAKMTRFATQVLAQGGYNEIEKQALKAQVTSYIKWLNGYINLNYGGLTTPYGYGRLDAFGAILNRVSSDLLNMPGNGSPANAPVSFPFLWNTSQLDWVQWNGSVNNHIGRNIGEVTGVFAHTILDTTNDKERFYSSANIINLDQLEQLMSRLDSPKWKAPLPPIDQAKAERGKKLFAQNCVDCHGVRDKQGQFPMTPKNIYGKEFIKISMTPLQATATEPAIGTDPLMAMNFVNPALDVDPGPMRKYIIGFLVSKAKTDEQKAAIVAKYSAADKVPRALILTAATALIINKQVQGFNLDEKQFLELTGYREERAPPNLVAYKGRPLNGIWATAPYMHNGSMANLYQTLLPEDQRETSFTVGNTEFDSEKVGYKPSKTGNRFVFNTLDDTGKPIAGNSNKGHSGDRFTKTLDSSGQWQDFTDAQRYELIEYMKTL